MSVTASPIYSATAIPAKYKKYLESDFVLVSAAIKGLPPKAVLDFIKFSGLSNSAVAYLLNKTTRAFNSYIAKEIQLDATTSEKLLMIFAVYGKGIEIFGSAEEFNTWLSLPAFGLGEMIPLTLINTITGIELVIQELVRIEYGVLA